MAVDRIAKKTGVSFRRSLLKRAYIIQEKLYGQEVLLVKPLTFMNHSGSALARCLPRGYDVNDLLIVYDDMDIELGRIKFARSGRAAGHNGLDSILATLRTQDIPRLKIGISRPQDMDPVEYVLSDFNDDETVVIDQALTQAETACREWVQYGIEQVMQKYNQRK